jgi:hypothetical protein
VGALVALKKKKFPGSVFQESPCCFAAMNQRDWLG